MTKAGEQPTITQSLKPCPFCGGEASDAGYSKYSMPLTDTTWEDGSPVTETFFVNCMKCGAVSRGDAIVRGYQTKAEAIAAWNTRTTSLAAQDNYVDATYLRECWNTCLGMDVSDWAHENVHDMLDTIEQQAKEIASLRDYITTAPPAPSLAAQDCLVEALGDMRNAIATGDTDWAVELINKTLSAIKVNPT